MRTALVAILIAPMSSLAPAMAADGTADVLITEGDIYVSADGGGGHGEGAIIKCPPSNGCAANATIEWSVENRSPYTITVKLANFRWKNPNGQWVPRNPFQHNQEPGPIEIDQHTTGNTTGKLLPSPQGGTYKYNIQVTVKGKETKWILDPRLEIR